MLRAARSTGLRKLMVGLAVAGGYATSALVGCVDLFHSTDFSAAASDAGDASPRSDATKPHDAGRDARDGAMDAKSGHPGDATLDHAVPGVDAAVEGGDARDGGGDAVAEASTGTMEAGGPEDAGKDVDSGANFCNYTTKEAQQYATHACLWLAACVGNSDLNEFGTCYPNALQAYDCKLNPNQQVRGALHAYWDALRTAATCADVERAVFGGAQPTCNNGSALCGTDLDDAGVNPGNVVVRCSGGKFVSAVNCSMAGWTCAAGVCALAGWDHAPCADVQTPPSQCQGNVFHSCQLIEADAGSSTPVFDVGKDCTYFGAGTCVGDGGAVMGCLPNATLTPCDASTAASCGADGSVTGCATGVLETLHCPEFGGGAKCAISPGNWSASSSQLATGCYNPALNGANQANGCSGAGFTDYAGPCSNVDVACPDAGFDGGCATTGASPRPYCQL